jgi:tetratricopeptide (TPR) repeat protein
MRLLGLCKVRLGDPPRGLALLEKARDFAPFDPHAQLHYGIGLHAVGRHAEAAEVFAACRADLPLDPAPHLNLASALLALGRADEAVAAFSDCLRLAPNFADAWVNLGIVHYRKSDIEVPKPRCVGRWVRRPGTAPRPPISEPFCG